MSAPIVILGAGLSGNLLAIVLARRGFEVTVYDRGPAPGNGHGNEAGSGGGSSSSGGGGGGRSINLALAARGIRALERVDAFAAVRPLLLPMQGRIVHAEDGTLRRLPYGQREHERIWSVGRDELNAGLHAIGRRLGRIDYRFEAACVDFDPVALSARMRSAQGEETIRPGLLLAADGAGSIVRRRLAAAGQVTAHEALLDHAYKELVIPPGRDGGFALAPDGLHIWPRGGFMLIALPNLDGSFTATLFLPRQGRPGFDTLAAGDVQDFFRREFPDVLPLMPGLAAEFGARPVGALGTVHCAPWSHRSGDGRHALLIGDAAHAIVPFHGQGMNAAFEDCACLDELLEHTGPDWPTVIAAFEDARRDNARAIAEMALENYAEMRDAVRDQAFERRAALAFELERRCPGRFIPRYAMVMFHPEIGYAEAQRRGRIQAGILDEAMRAGDADAALARALPLVEQRL